MTLPTPRGPLGIAMSGYRAMPGSLPEFAVIGVDHPAGMKPGRYFYVVFLRENRKVSRYCRRATTAHYKLKQYEDRYARGERNWPAVGRVCELRDSKYVLPTRSERHLIKVLDWYRRYGAGPGVLSELSR